MKMTQVRLPVHQIFIPIDNYEPESMLFDYHSIKQSPNFSRKNYNNAEFRGEMITKEVDGADKLIRHGFGIMIYESSRLYEGTIPINYLKLAK